MDEQAGNGVLLHDEELFSEQYDYFQESAIKIECDDNNDTKPALMTNVFCMNTTLNIKHTNSHSLSDVYTKEESSNVRQLLVLCTRVVPLKCDVCEKIFATLSSLNRHKQSHSLPFLQGMEVSEHKTKPNMRKFLQCDICPYTTSMKGHFKEHLKMHSTNKPFKCDTCGKSFRRESHMNVHKRTHEDITTQFFKCDSCPYITFERNCMISHLTTHNKLFKCDVCGKLLKSKDSLKYHKRIHRSVSCYICKKRFPSKSMYDEHKRLPNVHETCRKYQCDVCAYITMKRTHIISHLRTHSSKKPFKCKVCGRSLATKTSFNLHKLIHKGIVTCSVCDAQFPNKDLLNEHKAIPDVHKAYKKYQCDLCSYNSFIKMVFIYHIRRHDKPKKSIKCDECGEVCVGITNYKRHKHVNHRTFSCSICKEVFPDKKLRKEHKEDAHKALKFHCDQCPYVALKQATLIRHLHAHSMKNPCKCDVCGIVFKNKSALDSHKQIHNRFICYINKNPNIKINECEIAPDSFSSADRSAAGSSDLGYNLKTYHVSQESNGITYHQYNSEGQNFEEQNDLFDESMVKIECDSNID